jgi:NAD+ synthase
VAKLTKGLIVGTGNRDEDEMTRYFQKRGDGAVDISPIAKLHKSEVYQLLKFLECPQSILDATPSADLWGPGSGQADEVELGMTYQEVEWGVRELMDKPYSAALRHAIDETFKGDEKAEEFDKSWGTLYEEFEGRYDERQREVLSQLHEMEVNSLHKALTPEVFEIREEIGLVS